MKEKRKMKARIAVNLWGNCWGYIGGKRHTEFGMDTFSAGIWLDDMKSKGHPVKDDVRTTGAHQ